MKQLEFGGPPRPDAAERVGIYKFPGGFAYADKQREESGDYARLAFMDYQTLTLKIRRSCPPSLIPYIRDHAAQFKVGQVIQVSTCGQTVTLGQGVAGWGTK